MAESAAQTGGNLQIELCATCSAACPVRTDTRAYVDLIVQGRYEEAFEKIREFNPFPSVCSLICHHPCEGECRRQFVDESVALRNLKRFAVEQALEYRKRKRQKAAITQSKTVGVVGSGPAGLTVAHDCIKEGYAVTVYESLPKPGGLLVCAIPRYRLPLDDLQHDLDDIIALGVEIKTGVPVGKDIGLEELRKKHDVVVLALGLSESRGLPLENKDHPNVLLAMPFLLASALSEPMEVRRKLAERVGAARTVEPSSLTVPPMPFQLVEDAFDVVFECSGKAAAMETGLAQLRKTGTLCLLGTGMDRPQLDAMRVLLCELVVTGAYEYDEHGLSVALELIAGGRLETQLLVSAEDVGLDDLQRAMECLVAGKIGGKVLVAPG